MSRPLPLLRHFRKLKDPPINRRKLHSLEAILVIATCAVIPGANDFQQVALFAHKRKDGLARFLDLPNGVPSHDTFERVFARLDPVSFQECFARWMNAWFAKLTGKHLAIDGKAVCGSASPRKGFRCLHLVNVRATQANLCLGGVACEEDSNEITAIPRLLELLDLEGALVTIDAAGCQKKIAKQIIAAGGDYLLVAKENQGKLYETIRAFLDRAAEKEFHGVRDSYAEKVDRGHGRQENRCCLVIEAPEGMTEKDHWPGLKVIGMVPSMRTETDGQSSFDVRYLIGSKRAFVGSDISNDRMVSCRWLRTLSIGIIRIELTSRVRFVSSLGSTSEGKPEPGVRFPRPSQTVFRQCRNSAPKPSTTMLLVLARRLPA